MGEDPWAFLSSLFGAGGNGFDQGLAMLTAAQDPAMAGMMLDQMGVPLPNGSPQFGQTPSPLGNLVNPQGPPPEQPGLMTSNQMAPQLGYNPASPGPTQIAQSGPGAGPPGTMGPRAPGQMPRIQPPTAPQPAMHGGVTGGVKVPEPQKIVAGQMPGTVQALIASMLGGQRQNPLTVPSLGSLISGRG